MSQQAPTADKKHPRPRHTIWSEATPLDAAYFARVSTETRGDMRKEHYRAAKSAMTLVNTESGIPLVAVQLFDDATPRAIEVAGAAAGAGAPVACKTDAHVDAWRRGVSTLKIVVTNMCDQGFVLCNIFDVASATRTPDGALVPLNEVNALGPWSCTAPAHIGTGRQLTRLTIAVAPQVCTNRMRRLFEKTHWCSTKNFKINSINRDAEFAKVEEFMKNQKIEPKAGAAVDTDQNETSGVPDCAMPPGMTIEEVTGDIEQCRIDDAATRAAPTGVANMCTFDFDSCAPIVDWAIAIV
jgi:hypothetical protein